MAKDKSVLWVKLNTDQEDKIREDIEDEMGVIVQEQEEMDFDLMTQSNQDMYEGVVDENKDFPWEDSANFHIHLTAMPLRS